MAQLMSASELAREFNVSRQAVHSWKKRKSFPKPVREEARSLGPRTPVWDVDEVREWRDR